MCRKIIGYWSVALRISKASGLFDFKTFSEAESAPIRSAVKFPFTIDIRIFFQLFQNNIFRSISKKNLKNRKFQKFQKPKSEKNEF